MTAAVARVATDADHPLMVGYAVHCQGLVDAGGITDRARRDRLRLARRFLDQHGDLDGWMARPTSARLSDLRRIRAWPLLSFAVGGAAPLQRVRPLRRPGGVRGVSR